MMNRTLIFILIILCASSCNKRIVLSNWIGNKSFKVGDSLIYVTKNSFDTLPKCKSKYNNKDSLRNLEFDHVRFIDRNYFSVSKISHYSFDSLCGAERKSIKQTNKQEFKLKWKDFDTVVGIDSNWIFYYKRAHYSEPIKVYYDNLSYLMTFRHLTECDGFIKSYYKSVKLLYLKKFVKWRLYRWDIPKEKLKIKGGTKTRLKKTELHQ